ncbi:uncharacterized protein AB675_6406 [Cyphellophora attinorum]|uniref:Transcription factor domain-containing protein n=1 Tax=Cyphellophora attinorum TaxID=1664694 RepID=A0A0N1H964_9EURO|nr:uncharacterized protein AB675_6406 [Phialophora attinorum]KPI43935.1 hypothetical protein AB675_6406 [Phialophora attinorum]
MTFITTSKSDEGRAVGESRSVRYREIRFVRGPSRHKQMKARSPPVAAQDVQLTECDGEANAEACDDAVMGALVCTVSPLSNVAPSRGVPYLQIESPTDTTRGRQEGAMESQITVSPTGKLDSSAARSYTSPHEDILQDSLDQVIFSATTSKLLESAEPPTSEKNPETLLICHFRYILAPIIDGGDIKGPFGIQAMLFAKHRPAVLAALMAASAYHRSLISPKTKAEDLARSERFHHEAEASIASQDSAGQLFARMLLALTHFLRQSPSSWTKHVSQTTAVFIEWTSFSADKACWEPFAWFRLRIDLAAALWDKRAPITALDQHLHLLIDSYPNLEGLSLRHRYHGSLVLLYRVLALVYGGLAYTHPRSTVDATNFVDDTPGGFKSIWLALWADCQAWYNLRPATMRPVLYMSTMDACRLDSMALGAFPIYVYTNALSILANVAYHISTLLLVLHKPSGLKVSAAPEKALTENWHVQSIVGMARRNDFPEQWDPVMCSGLLFVARWMTHKSQQTALLSCLEKCSTTAGFELQHEMHKIRELWNTSHASR